MGVCFILVLDTVMRLAWPALHPSACLEYMHPDQDCFGIHHTVHICITQHLMQHCILVSVCFIFLPSVAQPTPINPFLLVIVSPIWKE
jgi:hypothetical protein